MEMLHASRIPTSRFRNVAHDTWLGTGGMRASCLASSFESISWVVRKAMFGVSPVWVALQRDWILATFSHEIATALHPF